MHKKEYSLTEKTEQELLRLLEPLHKLHASPDFFNRVLDKIGVSPLQSPETQQGEEEEETASALVFPAPETDKAEQDITEETEQKLLHLLEPLNKLVMPRQPIVGRQAERARLRACFERARGGQRQFVFVSGEPGIG